MVNDVPLLLEWTKQIQPWQDVNAYGNTLHSRKHSLSPGAGTVAPV
jgi:hypothetical protein